MKISFPSLLLFMPLFFLIQSTAKAQAFAPEHAEWWHNGMYHFGSTGGFSLIHAWVKGDSVLQGQTAKVIGQELFHKSVDPQQHITTIDTFLKRDLYIYEEMDTVFIFNENFNRFTPLFVYNVTEGDTVCLPVITDIYGESDLRPNPIAGGDTCFCFVVDSIRTVLYDTTYLETIFQHSLFEIQSAPYGYAYPVSNWSYPYVWTNAAEGKYARLVGGLYNGFLPERIEPYMSKSTQDTLGEYHAYYELRCYTDDSLAIHILPQDYSEGCYYNPPTSINAVPSAIPSFSIYPNPTAGKVKVKANTVFEKNTTLTLSDISGRVLQHLEIPAGKTEWTFQMKDVQPGLYLLTISCSSQKQVQKIIVSPH